LIDIHSHILPGVDDGAQSMEDAIKMARAAVNDGIKVLCATPHHRNGRYENEKILIEQEVQRLNNELEKQDIPLYIVPGQEIRLYRDLLDDLDRDLLLPISKEGNYFLVEFPSNRVPDYAAHLCYELKIRGYTPIIVHPERNSELIEKPELLYELVKEGALTQVTASSVIGKFGKNIMNFSHDIIRANMAHFIASDAHNVSSRGFHLTEAYEFIHKKFGAGMRYYLQENAELVIQGQTVLAEEPLVIKKKKFLGIF
jgi:protein-tyrosine phosphatase